MVPPTLIFWVEEQQLQKCPTSDDSYTLYMVYAKGNVSILGLHCGQLPGTVVRPQCLAAQPSGYYGSV
jgi:hypothetical protein